ncbi:CHAT domain-containing protein [Nocardia fluminea]|nr:CHAT domain-containing protein [Nocardia fluminea]
MAVELSDDAPDKARCLSMLHEALGKLFEETGNRQWIDEAIDIGRRYLSMARAKSSDQLTGMSNLIGTLRRRFDGFGDLRDLDEAIMTGHAALTPVPNDPAVLAEISSGLGAALIRRAQITGADADIAEGIAALRAAAAADLADSDRARYRVNLAIALYSEFSRTGAREDLDAAIDTVRTAPESIDDHVRIGVLDTLGGLLFIRSQRYGSEEDLSESIRLHREVLTGTGESPKTAHLGNFALALGMRFRRRGDVADLDESIQMARRVVAQTTGPDSARAQALAILSSALGDRFDYEGAIDALNEAIDLAKQAVALAGEGNYRVQDYLGSLSVMLQQRYERNGSLSDIDAAVAASERAVGLLFRGKATSPGHLTMYGKALRLRFDRTGDRPDIDAAVQQGRAAVESAPVGSVGRPGYFSNLGLAYAVRFDRFGDRADLDRSIEAARESVGSTRTDDRHMVRGLSNLGNALRSRAEIADCTGDLDEAIEVGVQAVAILEQSTVDGYEHPDLAAVRSNLGTALADHFARTGDRADGETAVATFRAAAIAPAAAPNVRLGAAARWARTATAAGDAEQAHTAYRTAVHQYSRVVLRGLDRADGEQQAERWTGLAGEAAAQALSIGKVDAAVAILEQGRAILWSHLFTDRDDLTELRRLQPTLADQVESAMRIVNGEDGRLSDESSEPAVAKQPLDRVAAAMRLDQLAESIRDEIPGFETFLATPSIDDLRPAEPDTVVVMVNIAPQRCDAIAVDTSSARPIPLSTMTAEDVERWVEAYLGAMAEYDRALEQVAIARAQVEEHPDLRSRFRYTDANRALQSSIMAVESTLVDICESLWDHIAVPVLRRLGVMTNRPQGVPPPRLWWCPTGKLALLPLHAAGRHDRSAQTTCVADHVVSSYTPTLRALRQHRRAPTVRSDDDQAELLIVSVPSPLGSDHLAGAAIEVDRLRSRFGDRCTVIEGANATVETVLAALPRYRWVHFSCHGDQELSDPATGGLELVGRRLSIAAISESRYRGEFAYLSACKTATGGIRVPDEIVTTAAALHYCGYQHVIATLWSVPDDIATEIADSVYSTLRTADYFTPAQSARAVHSAVARIRANPNASLRDWLPFIHIGP